MDIPFRPRGGQTQQQKEREQAFAGELLTLAESLDFKMSARGWCYHLEAHGLAKGDFDRGEKLINALRKEGVLPIDLVAESEQRRVEGLEMVDDYKSPEEFAEYLRWVLKRESRLWTPSSQWDTQRNYVELVVEKIDLVGLFSPVCEEFGITVTNMQGWSDPLTRATQMARFVGHRRAKRKPVVLYITDHDPVGLRIAALLPGHYDVLAGAHWMDGTAIDWTSDSVEVRRIGLTAELVEQLGLTWIEGLETSSGQDMADPNHDSHNQAHIQRYLRRYGPRKVEANALVARIDEARAWLCELLPQYIDVKALRRYRREMERQREQFASRVSLTLKR